MTVTWQKLQKIFIEWQRYGALHCNNSRFHSLSLTHSITHSLILSFVRSFIHSFIQPSVINQSINQSINHSVNQSDSQSVSQSGTQFTSQSINQSNNQSINQSINQSLCYIMHAEVILNYKFFNISVNAPTRRLARFLCSSLKKELRFRLTTSMHS